MNELRGLQLRDPHVLDGGGPRQVLRHVALVGAHRVLGDVAIELEEAQKRLQVLAQVLRDIRDLAHGEQSAAPLALPVAALMRHAYGAPRAGAASQSSKSASARAAIRAFFFALSRGGFGSGSMIPCVMLLGW